MSRLLVLTPFLLGIIFQVGTILGVGAVTAGLFERRNNPYLGKEPRRVFVRDVDLALSVPSAGTLVVSSLVVPGVESANKGIFVAVAVVGSFALYVAIARTSPNRYWTWRGVTPLSASMMTANAILGTASVLLAS